MISLWVLWGGRVVLRPRMVHLPLRQRECRIVTTPELCGDNGHSALVISGHEAAARLRLGPESLPKRGLCSDLRIAAM
jgi:hypothetical protein